MLLQTEQRRSLAFNSRTATARASASAAGERRMWKASRCALLAPIPGSLRSSSINCDIGSANRDKWFLCFGSLTLDKSWRKVQSTQHTGEARLHRFVHAAAGVVDGGDDEVFEHLDVGGVSAQSQHSRWVDGELLDLLLSVHADADRASA